MKCNTRTLKQLVQAVEQARGQVGEAAARASFRIKKSVLRLSKVNKMHAEELP